MSKLTIGLFKNSQSAGEAISNLKNKGYTNHISFVIKNEGGDTSTHTVKNDAKTGASVGAVIGGSVGALAAIIAGGVTATIPGGVLLIAGPLAALWGVSGGALGALSGGLVGALVDLGVSKDVAKKFEDYISKGQVLVSVKSDDDAADSVVQSMQAMGAADVVMLPVTK